MLLMPSTKRSLLGDGANIAHPHRSNKPLSCFLDVRSLYHLKPKRSFGQQLSRAYRRCLPRSQDLVAPQAKARPLAHVQMRTQPQQRQKGQPLAGKLHLADQAPQFHSPSLPLRIAFPAVPAQGRRHGLHRGGTLDPLPVVQVQFGPAVKACPKFEVRRNKARTNWEKSSRRT